MQIVYKWILIFACAAFFILSDSLSASWGKTGQANPLIVMTILAPIGYLLFGLINRNSTLAVSSGLVNVIIIIGTIMVSVFYFKDPVTGRQTIGLLFAFLAVALLF
jgi:multidrug transporter EmrE-like cation transporter